MSTFVDELIGRNEVAKPLDYRVQAADFARSSRIRPLPDSARFRCPIWHESDSLMESWVSIRTRAALRWRAALSMLKTCLTLNFQNG